MHSLIIEEKFKHIDGGIFEKSKLRNISEPLLLVFVNKRIVYLKYSYDRRYILRP